MNGNIKRLFAGFVSTAILAVSASVSAPVTSVNAADGANYAEALELSLYFYDANMCGTEITDGPLTWRGDCHTYDAKASLNNATGLSSSAKAVVSAANGGGDTADVSGGYHDAGDHVKFNITMAFNGASLGWAYYSYPNAFKDTGTEDHLFYIMRRTSDYFMKTTYLDDSGNVAAICHTVSNDSDHGIWTAPEVQTYDRPTYWLSAENNNNRICYQMTASLASTAAALKKSDPQYAAECMKYADAIYQFSKKYSGNETGGMGSMYGTDPSNVPGDKAWAELWMHIADSSYPLPTDKPTSNGCYNGSDYDGWIYSWGKVWGAYACLMSEITGDQSYLNEVKYNSDRFSNNNERKYYIINDWGNSRYNCAWQAYALTYGRLANNQSYLDAAKYQMDFILGDNPAGYSYLIGYSDKYPTRIHHRAANPDKGASKYTLYGALVGGASDISGSITDDVDAYAQTEMALDYNACFTVAIAGMYDSFGGDTTTAKNVIDKASEINKNFKYGSDDIIVEPEFFTAEISVLDKDTGEFVPGAEVWLKEIYTDCEESDETTISTWNTSDDNPKTFTELKAFVENSNYSYSYEYGISKLPEDYELVELDQPMTITASGGENVFVAIKLAKKPESTTEEPTTEEPTTKENDIMYGDANVDGKLDISDVVAIMCYSANSDASPLSEQGLINADVNERGNGINTSDAVAVQKHLVKLILSLPES